MRCCVLAGVRKAKFDYTRLVNQYKLNEERIKLLRELKHFLKNAAIYNARPTEITFMDRVVKLCKSKTIAK